MQFLTELFRTSNDLTILQMGIRAIFIFFYALLLMRLAGRRSFVMNEPIDNIFVILLGAILSRSVVGASPFFPTIISCLILSILHRILGLISSENYHWFDTLTGRRILLFTNNQFIPKNLRRGLLNEQDILSEVRRCLNQNNFYGIEAIYLEKNGKISIVAKNNK